METKQKEILLNKKIFLSIGILLFGLLIIYWVFANTILKYIAEKEISELHGAEVNIGNVDHTLFPISIILDNIEFTDANVPKNNQVQIGQVRADVEFIPLLSQKILLDNVLIDELAFSQLRREEGKVFRPPNQHFQKILDGLPSIEDISTKDEMLARLSLQTPAALESVKAIKASHIEPLKTQAKNLPTKADIKAYKVAFDALKKIDYKNPEALLKAKAQWDKIKTKMQNDKVKIHKFNALAEETKTALSTLLLLLNNAPKNDYAQLKDAFKINTDGLSQLTQIVFGEKARQFNQSLIAIIHSIAPMLSSGPDNPITPTEPNSPYPNFLVKQAEINLLLGNQTITSHWLNITDQHIITQTPTTFMIQATQNTMWKKFTMAGNFEVLSSGINAQQDWEIEGLKLENISVSKSPRLPATIETANLFTTGNISMENNILSGDAHFIFNQLKLDATGNDKYTQIIAQALSALDKLAITTSYSGDIHSPSLTLKSDLDNSLSHTLIKGITTDQVDTLAELRHSLEAQAAEGLGITRFELAEVNQLLQLTSHNMNTVDNLLKGHLTNSNTLKNKLMDKLKGKLFED